MNALALASKVSMHPTIVKMRAQQEAMRRQMVRDYGNDFMMGGHEMPNMTFANGRKSPRFAGVHYWTPAQRDAWNDLTARLRNARAYLRSLYVAA